MTRTNSKIGILLATFNSERFLKIQLHSIVSQTLPPHEIIISDDHSVDATNEILELLIDDYGHSIRIDSRSNAAEAHGLHSNFRNLFKLALDSSSDVFLLSDHDDIWLSKRWRLLPLCWTL